LSGFAVATIVASFGRHYEVALPDGRLIMGIPRGKRSELAVGDRVELGPEAGEGAQIIRHLPRASLLFRSDAYRQKLIAANATQVVLVVATEPAFSDELLSRAVVAAEDQKLAVVIVLNKIDLVAGLESARRFLAPFAALGYPVIELCAKADVLPLARMLRDQTSVLVGQSGMGKSTLVNALVPAAVAATREISTALDSGKHTTTHARMYSLPEGGHVIDSPGMQEFGLAHLSLGKIEAGFAEFRPLLGHCRFRDCRHHQEPDCAVRQALGAGAVDSRRYLHFCNLMRESAHRSHLR
jgi:ribosome biogenesis GTPase